MTPTASPFSISKLEGVQRPVLLDLARPLQDAAQQFLGEEWLLPQDAVGLRDVVESDRHAHQIRSANSRS